MNLTEEQLKELEELAGLGFEIKDMMLVLEIPLHEEDEFKDMIELNTDHAMHKAYQRGRLKSLVELRQAIKQAALNGSNPAQMSMIEFFKQSKI